MLRWAVLLLLTLTQTASAQVELKWKWKQDQTFWVQTVTKVDQSFLIEDASAIRVTRDVPPADLSGEDRRAREQIVFLGTKARPHERALLSRRTLAAFAATPGSGPMPAVALLAPLRLAWEREVRQTYKYTTWTRYLVRERKSDGSAVVEQRLEKERLPTIDPPPRAESFDTGLEDVVLTLHVKDTGEVTKVEGAGAALLEKATATDSEHRKILEEMLSEATLKAAASQTLGVFPPNKVKPGDTWPSPFELNLGALGKAKIQRTFTFEGTRGSDPMTVALVSVASQLVGHEANKEKKQAIQLTEAHWTAGEGQTKIEIDVSAGRPLESESKVTLAGFVTLANTGGTAYRGRVTLSQEVVTKVFDKDKLPPLEKKN